MAELIAELKTTLSSLSIKERGELASFLLRTLPDSDDSEIEDAWTKIIDERIEELNSGKVKPIPEEEVLKRLANIGK